MTRVVGNGQLAEAFQDFSLEDMVIFASGVSNSNCTSKEEFNREKKLLISHLDKNKDKKFVYFSSCALSAENYEQNYYYQHKRKMENIIKNSSNHYYIFRIPQLFGNLILHTTLINFFYKSIINGDTFSVYDEGYRYVIDINDVKKLVMAYLVSSESNIIVDIANPYRYRVLHIVEILESLLEKSAHYSVLRKKDEYTLDLENMMKFIKKENINLDFGKEYLRTRLKKRISTLRHIQSMRQPPSRRGTQ